MNGRGTSDGLSLDCHTTVTRVNSESRGRKGSRATQRVAHVVAHQFDWLFRITCYTAHVIRIHAEWIGHLLVHARSPQEATGMHVQPGRRCAHDTAAGLHDVYAMKVRVSVYSVAHFG